MLTKQCQICGEEFKVRPSRYEQAKFCSYECTNKAKKGQKHSEETRLKMSEKRKGGTKGSFQKGHIPWHAGKKGVKPASSTSFHKGHTPWNKGKSVKTNNALDRWRENGGVPWNKGKKGIYTKEQLDKIKQVRKKQKVPSDKEHWYWKGRKATHSPKHKWIVRHYGNPPVCEACGKRGRYIKRKNGERVWNLHWANIDHKYRRVREDYRGLCPKCHKIFDNAMRNDLQKAQFRGDLKNK